MKLKLTLKRFAVIKVIVSEYAGRMIDIDLSMELANRISSNFKSLSESDIFQIYEILMKFAGAKLDNDLVDKCAAAISYNFDNIAKNKPIDVSLFCDDSKPSGVQIIDMFKIDENKYLVEMFIFHGPLVGNKVFTILSSNSIRYMSKFMGFSRVKQSQKIGAKPRKLMVLRSVMDISRMFVVIKIKDFDCDRRTIKLSGIVKDNSCIRANKKIYNSRLPENRNCPISAPSNMPCGNCLEGRDKCKLSPHKLGLLYGKCSICDRNGVHLGRNLICARCMLLPIRRIR